MKPGEVTLRRHPLRWRRVPSSIKVRVVSGLDRIARIRAGLSESVQVVSLPPVVVYDALWTSPDMTGSVSGRAGPVTRGKHTVFGVELPVNVALTDDEEAVRAVLLHEFGHCFYYMARTIEAVDAGVTEVSDVFGGIGRVYTDEAADRARLVDPTEWFKGDAATAFPYWNDARVERIVAIAPQFAEYFCVEPGALGFETHQLSIPEDVVMHLQQLRKRT